MERIKLIRNNLTFSQLKNKTETYVSSAYDYLNLDQFLTDKEVSYRKNLRKYLETEISPKISQFIEKEEFPLDLIKNLINKFPGILASTIQGYKSANFSQSLATAVSIEIARIDMSLFSFAAIHGGEVAMRTIYELGSEKQKEYYLPKLNTLEFIGAFCLTEPENGSDAYNIKTTAIQDSEGNYVINGKKRWIGQGTIADIFIVWANNPKTKEIEGFIVEKERIGISCKKIEGKLALRCLQNADLIFDNVKIPMENKLEKANSFSNSVSKVFLSSRIGCAWGVIGLCIGAYDVAIKYVIERKQFGKSLSSFQLVQEKLTKIMGNIQAMTFLARRISEYYEKGDATMGMAGLCKSWCTSRGRETIALAREILGGNGILNENYVMRALGDIEALHTGEGTYDINILLAGRELTGKLALV
jgi:alkylation response protein AidB-like acyl-CoA dehydrogenase